jgi:hypothetical protein
LEDLGLWQDRLLDKNETSEENDHLFLNRIIYFVFSSSEQLLREEGASSNVFLITRQENCWYNIVICY